MRTFAVSQTVQCRSLAGGTISMRSRGRLGWQSTPTGVAPAQRTFGGFVAR